LSLHGSLSGGIPSFIGDLVNLEYLDLGYTQLSGSIPSTLGNLAKLKHLDLQENQLSGDVSFLGNLINLEYLDLFANQLSGTIPSALGNLTNLTHLELSHNRLSGSIPVELGSLVNIDTLELWGNQLSGSIPSSIGSLINLKELILADNQLSGSIPAEIGNLINLEFLNLSFNQLTGSIPSSIGNLRNLKRSLWISDNRLSGSIPSSISSLVNLDEIDLSNNQLNGSIPSSIGNLVNLQGLSLSTNQLSGSIPSSIGNLVNLQGLDLNNNQLNGSIPSSLANLSPLLYLHLHHNYFKFDGMELIANKFPNAFYAPQAIIPIYKTNNRLYVSVGGTPSNNTYYWLKDGILMATIIADSTFTPITSGHYAVTVTNKIATQLTLYSDSALALPLTLLDFTATKTGKFNLLQWSTSHEINSSHFNIQRSSNGVVFSNIGFVRANNINNITNKYQFTDRAPLAGANYYRLQIVDKDGYNEYSKIIIIKDDFAASSIYPIPANNILTVETIGNTQFSMSDQSGRILFTTTINGKGTIDVSSLSAGVYFVKNSNTGAVEKIIIAR